MQKRNYYIPFGLLKELFLRLENQFWNDRIKNKGKNNIAGLVLSERYATNIKHYSLQLTSQHIW